MSPRIFATSDDVHTEIVTALESSAEVADADAEFDIEAIADECFVYDAAAGGFVQSADTVEFWASVERNAR